MKKLLVLSLAACMFDFAASAQTERPAATQGASPEQRHHHKGKHDHHEMMKQLNLSKEQKAQMKAQHKEMKAQKEALKAQGLSAEEMKQKQKALHQEQRSKMEGILTADQKAKMTEIRKQKMAEKGNKPLKNKDQ